jgi:Ca-activated chloride channel family protein
MNSQSPHSPEDRLLDELLREQAQCLDEAFIRQIEIAIDAGAGTLEKTAVRRSPAVAAIAAALVLSAGIARWWHSSDANTPRPLANQQIQRVGGTVKRPQSPPPIDPIAAPSLAAAADLSQKMANHERAPADPEVARAASMLGEGLGISQGFGRDRSHGDPYGTFIDPPWRSSTQDPISTFSIDVDTASYSNVRRMIREGRKVPKDAVRIEECINAFRYAYAKPQGDAPFALGATLAVCPWAPTHQLVRIAIKGRELDAATRPASNLVFLIDVSGSMQSPDKLPLLKQSMLTLVDQLDERDRVAIVVYAGSEGVALPSTPLDAKGRTEVAKALGQLEAGGSTNGGAGIQRAYELAQAQTIEGGINRVILATDGDFNVGVTARSALVDLVKSRAQAGVYLTVLGFGSGNLNDAMMDAISRDGNGNYFYLDSEREARKVLLQNLHGTLVTIAKDVKIQVEFNPEKVSKYRLIGYANRVLRNQDFDNDQVDAGDIGAGHTVTAFYEVSGTADLTTPLNPQPRGEAPPSPAAEWLTVKLRYKQPDSADSKMLEFSLTGIPTAPATTDADFQFASAVALFGMKLREMDEVKEMGWGIVSALAEPGVGTDPTEERSEFLSLLKTLQDQSGESPSEPTSDIKVRTLDHPDGSRTRFTRTGDHKTVIKEAISPSGRVTMTAIYTIDEHGNPRTCTIRDEQHQECFKVRYGYRKANGDLVEERIFDAKTKRQDPASGEEVPVQRVVYLYEDGLPGRKPVIYSLIPGISLKRVFGQNTTALPPGFVDEADWDVEVPDKRPIRRIVR